MAGVDSKTSGPDGLIGQWLSLEELGQLDFFKSKKRPFKIKLNTNFSPAPGDGAPGIKAAVRREYQKGDVICKAGEYGSTAFLILEGSATAAVPETTAPQGVQGRTRSSLARLRDLFARRSLARRAAAPQELEVGEVSPYASISCEHPPPPQTLGPGAVFGIDACINFYPREATVRAEERCVVLEMLRSVLDTVREAGDAGGGVEAAYRDRAILNQLHLSPLFRGLGDTVIAGIAGRAELVDYDSEEIKNGVIYAEGDAADAVYLVRSGTIKLAQQRGGGEFVFAYLGRGASFGFENVLPAPQQLATPVLRCLSHPGDFQPVEVKGICSIGRATNSDVALPAENRAVGRRHCRIEERDGDLFLIDLDSANFTLLNGERIREARLTPGDRITVVDYTFELTQTIPEATASGAAPRMATATGLDNFEIVRVGGDELRRLAASDAQFREVLATVSRAVDTAAAARVLPDPAALAPLIELNLYNSQNTLLIDLDRCTRCDECVRACADAHGGVTRFTRDGPRFGKYLVTGACRSCSDPKCMVGCPVGSIRRQGSLEIHIEDWCIGCQRCANQCPFGNINMIELPAVAAAPEAPVEAAKLRATVCDLCAGLDGPSCVYACPHDAAIRVNPAAYLSSGDLR